MEINQNPVQQMKRYEIIFALRKHVRYGYHSILKWPTEGLRALLEYYEEPKEVLSPYSPALNSHMPPLYIGCDMGKGTDKTVLARVRKVGDMVVVTEFTQ